MSSKAASPIKALGQNFLRYEKIVWQIIKVADLKPSDVVIEVGPGKGALTFKLAQKARKVIAVEKDRNMVEILNKSISQKGISNIEVIHEDILNFQFSIFNFQSYKVVANLPYNIATAVIMKFLEAKNQPELMAVITQKEIGQKITAKPGEMSKLSVFNQLYSDVKIAGYISRKCFYPQPKVDGAILLIQPKKIILKPRDLAIFTQIVRAGFVWPRKQLSNNLAKGLDISRDKTNQWLQQNQISPADRPETLAIEAWLKLTKSFPQVIIKK